MRSITSGRSSVLLLALLCAATTASAVDYKNEFEKKVKASQNVGVLGNDLAGDKVNFLNGITSFSVTDASLPGNNGLAVALTRSYKVEFNHSGGIFGDWDLDIPYISTVMANGWQIDSTTPLKRCSISTNHKADGSLATGLPPTILTYDDNDPLHRDSWAFWPNDYFHGYSLHTAGGDQSMLRPAANVQRPGLVPAETYEWNTNQNWWFSCLPISASAGNGEGFKAIAPDGTKYWFDQMNVRGSEMVEATDSWDDAGLPQTFHFYLERAEYRLYASRVEDRFGNSVSYTWSNGKLTAITSSDGRTIQLTYLANALVSEVTDGTRTWKYNYYYDPNLHVTTLTSVVLPDNSSWQYSFAALSARYRPSQNCILWNAPITTWDCYGGGYYNDPVATHAYVKHPSGATVDFLFDAHFQPSTKTGVLGSWPLSLSEKTINGPGLQEAKWKYAFAPDVPAFSAACKTSSPLTFDGCLKYVITDELDPDNTVTRRVYNMDSQLLAQMRGRMNSTVPDGSSPPVLTTSRWGSDIIDDPSPLSGVVPTFYQVSETTFAPGDETVQYLAKVGSDLVNGDSYTSERRLPEKSSTVRQQNATFTRTNNTFDTFAQPTSVTHASTGLSGPQSGYTRTEANTYSNNTKLWVLSQLATVTKAGLSNPISETVYSATTALPTSTYSFGILQQKITYNADGTVLKVQDGRNSAIKVADWYRGVPRQIYYPTAVGQINPSTLGESAVVDNIGNLISTTDELQYTTGYGYDAMGRLNSIAYPSADTVNWNPLSRGFAPVVGSGEGFGILAGQWKQTVSTGNGKATTYYDAQFHPVLTLSEDTGNPNSRSFVVKRFDSSGREIFTSYPVGTLGSVNDALSGVSTTYDVLGRVVQVSQASELGALLTTNQYLAGFQTRTINPRNYSTTTSFQVFDAPNTDSPVLIQAPENITTTITRDSFGKPLQITRSGPGPTMNMKSMNRELILLVGLVLAPSAYAVGGGGGCTPQPQCEGDDIAPTVSITSPVNGAATTAPGSFTLTAAADDADGDVMQVDFKSGTTLLGTSYGPNYSFTWSNIAPGTYAVRAVATDDLGVSTTSAPVNLTVNAGPVVNLTAPTDGATAPAPASFALTATATDSDGVAKVDFLSNGVWIGSDNTSPYTFTYSNLPTGAYSFTAVATDSGGFTSTSAARTVTVTGPPPPPATGSVTRTYVYDANERLCKVINPESGATVMDYDASGNIAWTAEGTSLTSNTCDRASVTAAQKTTRTYDAMNRVTAVTTPGGAADVTTTYYPDGAVNTLTAANSGGNVATTYTYNKRRLLTGETSTNGAVQYTLGYGYDANAHLSALTYPDNQTVTYLPDALGRATKVASGSTVYADAIAYYPGGAISGFTYGNGVVHTMTRNARMLPTRSQDVKSGVAVLDDTYDFDQNGNVLDIIDRTQGKQVIRAMGYDGVDRLTAVLADDLGTPTVNDALWGTATYTYDGMDNFLTAYQGTRKYVYGYNASTRRLDTIKTPTGAAVFSFGYDARGNTLSKSGQQYAFDSANRLTAVTGLQSYRYDGQGRRVQTTDADSKTTFWIYSQSGQVLYTSEARRSQNLEYIYLGNTQVATRAAAWNNGPVTVRYQHTDALGSPVAETSSTGTVLKRNIYAPYGEAYVPTVIDGTGYTGHVMDQATGLTYMQQRYYDPVVGRFLSPDPAKSEFNRFSYAANNPYRYIDPDGRVVKGGGSTMGPQNWNANGDFSMSVTFSAPVGDDYSRSDVHTMDILVGAGKFNGQGPTGKWSVAGTSPMQKLYIAAFVAREYHLNIDGMGFKWIGENRDDAHPTQNGFIELGGGSFKSAAYLGQIIGHELVHWAQPNHGSTGTNAGLWGNEARAYRYNVDSFGWFKNSASERAEFQASYDQYKAWETYHEPEE